MRQLTYRIVLKEEPEGGYTVTVPSLPGCITYGENIKESYLMAEEAIMAYIESQMKHGESIIDDRHTFEGVLNLEYA
jgi:predicted RNase H-like HicB family nuclease